MRKRLTLILGGARSGKSTYAQQLALERGAILYVATAEALDDEMTTRIAAHRAERPAHWRTLEAPRHVGRAINTYVSGFTPDVILLDCLTLLANNVIGPLPEPLTVEAAEAALDTEIEELLITYAASESDWLVVSNEVGLGLVPPYPLGRIYRDVLGRANQRLAMQADEVVFMIAGLPMKVKGG